MNYKFCVLYKALTELKSEYRMGVIHVIREALCHVNLNQNASKIQSIEGGDITYQRRRRESRVQALRGTA